MSPGAVGIDDANRRTRRRGMSPAQWYCLAAGLSLLLGGIFGFLADASFDTSGTSDVDRAGNADGELQGDGFLGFEVNAWHNIVHLLSGVALLAAFRRPGPARAVALAFGVVYAVVAVIGLIDGGDVLGFIPVNAADNVLHIALAALGIVAALLSRGDDRRDPPAEGPPPDRDRMHDGPAGDERVWGDARRDSAQRIRG